MAAIVAAAISQSFALSIRSAAVPIAPTTAASITNSTSARRHPSAAAASAMATATGADCCAVTREAAVPRNHSNPSESIKR